jgi:hypothetical protein
MLYAQKFVAILKGSLDMLIDCPILSKKFIHFFYLISSAAYNTGLISSQYLSMMWSIQLFTCLISQETGNKQEIADNKPSVPEPSVHCSYSGHQA